MDANWAACLKAILKQEGGNDDNPHDPGGRTSRGIIQREYDAYRTRKGLPHRDVWTASDDEVADIYLISYWRPWCPMMKPGIDLVFFDEAVNAGMHEATLILQRALSVNADGHIGIVTQTALDHADPRGTIHKFSEERRAVYRITRNFRYFGRDWIRRATEIEAQAIHLVEVAESSKSLAVP